MALNTELKAHSFINVAAYSYDSESGFPMHFSEDEKRILTVSQTKKRQNGRENMLSVFGRL